LIGVFVFLAVGYSSYPVQPRHFVWTGLFLCLALARLVCRGVYRPGKGLRSVPLVLTALLTLFFVWECREISAETFKVRPITGWLKDRGIGRKEVATVWWQINEMGGSGATSSIPLTLTTDGKIPYANLWFYDNPKFWIAWKPVLKITKKAGIGIC